MNPLKLAGALTLVVAIGAGLFLFWRHEERYPSTKDAYVGANIINVAPQVTGRVAQVAVVENQKVSAGDLLFTIDDTQFAATVDQSQADLDRAIQDAAAFGAQIKAAEAAVSGATIVYTTAQNNLDRAKALYAQGDIPETSLDQTTSENAQAATRLQAAKSALNSLQAGLVGKQDAVRSARAQLQLAQTDLVWTKITAPTDGWVSNLTLREGSAVSAYAPQFAIVEAADWWVDANFKETDLPRIRAGQPVTLRVDLLPGVDLTGTVGSIGRGSGATFSLLPPENASGNWVKVTRRFPVRIHLDPTDAPLRVGASTTVRVDTTTPPATQ